MKKKHDRTLENEILDAFVLLFNPECGVSLDSIKSIKPLEIKIAYRRKALESHPDRAHFIGKSERELSELFTKVTKAYEKLCEHSKDDWIVLKNISPSRFAGSIFSYKKESKPEKQETREEKKYYSQYSAYQKEEPKTSWSRQSNQSWQNNNNKEKSSGSASNTFNQNNTRENTGSANTGTCLKFKWGIPNSELLFGQFLYYSGIITWEELIKAIIWQRNQRPLFGQIAQSWNILSRDEVHQIIKEKKHKDKIGEYALKNGYINAFEQRAIIGKQKRMQYPIGQYFCTVGKLTADEIKIAVEKHRQHNIKARSLKKAV